MLISAGPRIRLVVPTTMFCLDVGISTVAISRPRSGAATSTEIGEVPKFNFRGPLTTLGLSCASNMLPLGREVQAERHSSLHAYRDSSKPGL